MRALLKALVLLVVLVAVASLAVVLYFRNRGLSAREEPGRIETAVARSVRTMVIAGKAQSLKNPVQHSDEVIVDGRAHFADHCAVCHANDGSGDTEMGHGMFPRPPDMRQSQTQGLSDGELFWIIENGIRFTGMPGWGNGTAEGEKASWALVHFIRRLSKLTEAELEEMESLNPKPPAEIRQQLEEDRFLSGADGPPASEPPHKHPGGQND